MCRPDRGRATSWWHDLAAVLPIARKELLVQARYRNKLVLDLLAHPLGVVPLLLTALAFAWAGRSEGPGIGGPAGDYASFILAGYMALTALGVGSPVLQYTGTAWALDGERRTGTLERAQLAPVGLEIVPVGVSLYYVGLNVLHVGLLFVGARLFLDLRVHDLGAVAFVILNLVAINLGLCLIGSGVLLLVRNPNLFLLIAHRPFVILSGAYFLIERAPEPFRSLALLNPISYVVDAFRGAMTGSTALLSLRYEMPLVAATGAATVILGFWVYRRVLDHLRATGELGTE